MDGLDARGSTGQIFAVRTLETIRTLFEGRYDVERELGRGGMATVYLAHDVRHGRKVGIKLLNPELAAIIGVERFLLEIRVTANLHHPNLLPLFDSGEVAGHLYYVMPYFESESLRARLDRETQLPVPEAVHIATSLASALDYAHRHGVIHRDLKPDNILLHEGEPVIADFGIALALTNAAGHRVTETGLSPGTPQYMSPEQVAGDRNIDARADIYALGAVTYEMLAGEAPITGSTAQAILARVLTDRPRSVRQVRDTVPIHVEAALDRALAKVPADRFATAHEFAEALTGRSIDLQTAIDTARSHAPGMQLRRSGWRLAGPALGVLAGILLAGTWSALSRPAPDPTTVRFEIGLGSGSTIPTGLGTSVAVAPGSRHFAYITTDAAARRLFIRPIGETNARAVPGSEFARWPFFSPDGAWVGFWAEGQLKRASVDDGNAVLIGDLPGESRVSWSPNGQLVLSVNGQIATMPAAGGPITILSTPDLAQGETGQTSPIALPDGRTALYTSLAMGGSPAARIGVISLDDGSTTILPVQGSFALGVRDGHLIYTTADGNVMAIPFDLRQRRVSGVPVPTGERVLVETGNPISYADLSPDGTLVYLSGVSQRRLIAVQPDGAQRTIIAEPRGYGWPRLSPDGRRIALTVSSHSRSDVWIYDMPSGPLTRLTIEGTRNDRPEWTPDGRHVVFRSNRDDRNTIWTQPVDGAGMASRLFGVDDAHIDEGVISPDGRYLLYQLDRVGRGELWYRALAGDTTSHRVGTGPVGEISGRFSPDGRWVVYASSESGAPQVYVRPFPSLATRYQVSTEGGATPVWSRDGSRIFYVVGDRIDMATIGSTEPFSITSRTTVASTGFSFNVVHADYDVAQDGSLLGFTPAGDALQFIAVRNWSTELRNRLAR